MHGTVAWWALVGAVATPAWLFLLARTCPSTVRTHVSAVVCAACAVLCSAGIGWRFADDPGLVTWWWAGLCSLGLAVIDLHEHRLPRSWVAAMGFGVLVEFAVLTVQRGDPPALWRAVTAAGLVWLAMRLIEVFCAGAMGAGDTRLQAVLALSLGWISWPAVLCGLMTGTLLLGVTAAVCWVWGHRGWKSRIPAGPSLLLGFWCALLVFAP